MISAILVLSGCGSIMGDGRMEAWKDVRKSEEATKQEVLKVKQIEKQAKPVRTQNPTLKLTAYDQTGKIVSVAEMDLQPVVAEITGGKDDDTYGLTISETPMPQSETAENLAAAGNAAGKVLNSPAAVGGVVGASVGAALRETGGGGARINGETVSIGDSFNRSDTKAIGSSNNVSGTLSTDKSSKVEAAPLPTE
jgi:hypothetical protein